MNRSDRSLWYKKGLRFECTQCGACCTGTPGTVEFTEAEGKAMAAQLGISTKEFYEQHAHKQGACWSLNEIPTEDPNSYDCSLLARNEETGMTFCTVHKSRPTQCRTWPFWPENLKSRRTWKRASQECEGMGIGPLIPLQKIIEERDRTPETGYPR